MIRRNRYQRKGSAQMELSKLDCTSTDSSESPRSICKESSFRPPIKEKLQLCKKFIEYGYCPYRNKCKFAHGSHELRKNNQKNSLYKTKQCVVFFRNGHCSYGDRCNFLHQKKDINHAERAKKMRANFGDLFASLRDESKLLGLIS